MRSFEPIVFEVEQEPNAPGFYRDSEFSRREKFISRCVKWTRVERICDAWRTLVI